MTKAWEDMTAEERRVHATLDVFNCTYFPKELEVSAGRFVYVRAPGGKNVATVYGASPMIYDTAYLFAAAPDLYAACDEARKLLATQFPGATQKIEAAMLKARGQITLAELGL